MHIIEHATGPPINMHTHTQTHTFLILQQTSPKLIYHSDWKWSLFNSTFAPFALQCIVSHQSQYLVSDNDRFKLFKSFSFSFTLVVVWSVTKKDSISFILLFFLSLCLQIMMGEGLMYCMQSKLKTCPKSEGSINAGGCSFNSFLRRTVRFVGAYNCQSFRAFGLLAGVKATLLFRAHLVTWCNSSGQIIDGHLWGHVRTLFF